MPKLPRNHPKWLPNPSQDRRRAKIWQIWPLGQKGPKRWPKRICGWPLGSHFVWFSEQLASLLQSTGFGMIFHWFRHGFWCYFGCFCDKIQARACNLQNLDFLWPYNRFACSCMSKKQDFPYFSVFLTRRKLASNFNAFWHRFWLHFGIDLPSFSCFFMADFWMIFCMSFFGHWQGQSEAGP